MLSQDHLRQLLREIGVHPRRAARLVQEHDPARIADLYHYMLYLIGQGKGPENPAAWLATAISEEWALPPEVTRTAEMEQTRSRTQDEVERLEYALERAREREAEQFRQQQAATMDRLGVDAQARRVWEQALGELRERGFYSPVFELAFLERIEGEAVTVLAQTDAIRQIIERSDRLEAIRAALRKVLGRQAIYLTVTTSEGAA